MPGGKNFLDDLQVGTFNSQLPAAAASEGELENPIVYSPRTSLTIDGPDMQGRVVLYESFSLLMQRTGAAALPVPNPHFGVAGTNAATSTQGLADSGNVVATAGASGDQAIVTPVPGQTLWDATLSAALRPLARFRFKVGSVTDCRLEFGVRTTTGAMNDAADDDKMIVRFDTSGPVSATNFVLVTSAGGVDTLSDTGVEAVANRDYVFTLAVNAARQVFLFSCDLAGAATGTDVQLACDPTAHVLDAASIGVPYGGIEALAVGAKNFRIQGFVRSQAL